MANAAKRILAVDDDFEDLQTIKAVLEKEGYKIVAATNGAQALDMLRSDGFNLILIDIRMPTLSGYDLLSLLREKLNHDVPMIFVTIVPEKEVEMEEVDGFVQKPFKPETLLKVVKKLAK